MQKDHSYGSEEGRVKKGSDVNLDTREFIRGVYLETGANWGLKEMN